MKTRIARKLNVKKFPLEVHDGNGNVIYKEYSDGYWEMWEYDDKGNKIYFENTYGYWHMKEYNDKGEVIYYDNSLGEIIDNRPISK